MGGGSLVHKVKGLGGWDWGPYKGEIVQIKANIYICVCVYERMCVCVRAYM